MRRFLISLNNRIIQMDNIPDEGDKLEAVLIRPLEECWEYLRQYDFPERYLVKLLTGKDAEEAMKLLWHGKNPICYCINIWTSNKIYFTTVSKESIPTLSWVYRNPHQTERIKIHGLTDHTIKNYRLGTAQKQPVEKSVPFFFGKSQISQEDRVNLGLEPVLFDKRGYDKRREA